MPSLTAGVGGSGSSIVYGTSTIFSGDSTTLVPHGLDSTPEAVVVTARDDVVLGVTARNATTFTVERSGSTGDLAFDWFAAGTAITPSTDYEAAVLALSPLLFWPLDDASGTAATAVAGADGTYSSGVVLRATGPSTQIPYAITTDGVDDNVLLADWPSFPIAGDVTVSLWAKWSTSTLTKVMLSLRHGTAGNEELVLIANRSAAGRVSLYRAGADRVSSAAATYNNGAWHHIAGVVDQAANTTKLYIDGSLVGSGTSAVPGSGDRSLLVGSNRTSDTAQFFPGSTAMVAVFDYPLTAGQIASLYTSGL